MEISKLDLVSIFKLRLLNLQSANIKEFFFIPKTYYKAYDPNQITTALECLYLDNVKERGSLRSFYKDIADLKINQIRVTMVLSKFSAGKHSFKDFRYKFAKYVDFKLSLDIARSGDSKTIEKVKMPANIFISAFNMSLFVRPGFVRNYAYTRLPGYIKNFEIFIRKAWFKRITTTFYSFVLSCGLPLVHMRSILQPLRLLLRIKVKSTLKSKSLQYYISCLRQVEQICYAVKQLTLSRGQLYEVLQDTGLIVFGSKHGKKNAKEGSPQKAKYFSVSHFAHYYPFSFFEKISGLQKFKKSRVFQTLTKILWLPRRFLITKKPEMLNIGYILNNYYRPNIYSSKSFFKVRSGFYSLAFKKSFNVFNSNLFHIFFHKITYNKI